MRQHLLAKEQLVVNFLLENFTQVADVFLDVRIIDEIRITNPDDDVVNFPGLKISNAVGQGYIVSRCDSDKCAHCQ